MRQNNVIHHNITQDNLTGLRHVPDGPAHFSAYGHVVSMFLQHDDNVLTRTGCTCHVMLCCVVVYCVVCMVMLCEGDGGAGDVYGWWCC